MPPDALPSSPPNRGDSEEPIPPPRPSEPTPPPLSKINMISDCHCVMNVPPQGGSTRLFSTYNIIMFPRYTALHLLIEETLQRNLSVGADR